MFVSWLEAEQVAQIAWQLFAAGYLAHNLLFASTREKKGDRGRLAIQYCQSPSQKHAGRLFTHCNTSMEK